MFVGTPAGVSGDEDLHDWAGETEPILAVRVWEYRVNMAAPDPRHGITPVPVPLRQPPTSVLEE